MSTDYPHLSPGVSWGQAARAELSRTRGRAVPAARGVLALNLAGSAVLAVLALIGHQWGFLLLEGAWSAVPAVSLARDTLR